MIIKNIVTQSVLVFAIMASFFLYHTPVPAYTTPSETLSFYSFDYHEARNKFLVAARNSGGRIKSYQNPITGPTGKLLYIDAAFFGERNPEKVVVLASGTHGVEGFAGSAIQTGLLRQGLVANIGPNLGIVMIHAINPYGVAHLRRVNEENIDLNRNFLDHSEPYPVNEGYAQLTDVIAPESMSLWNDAKAKIRFFFYKLWHGRTELQRAISSGQYTHPKGLFYGGNNTTWSNKTIREITNSHFSNAKRVVIIDIHTGLGAKGNTEVIMNVSKESSAYKRAVQWWGDIVRTTVTGESVSPHLHGTLKLAFPKMLPDSEVTAVSLEFGTFSPKEVFWALRSENWLHHYGGIKNPANNRIKNELLRVFYPDDREWKINVWQKGNEVVRSVLGQL